MFKQNPFGDPIRNHVRVLLSIKWSFPYIPQLIQSIVLPIVIGVLSILYITIGIASQIVSMFLNMIRDAQSAMVNVTSVEKSGYVVAIGIYCIMLSPFWLLQFPLWALGKLYESIWSKEKDDIDISAVKTSEEISVG